MAHSAGIVLWRSTGEPGEADPGSRIEILLAHPGGPFWAKKDEHAWSIPKGEFDPDEEPAWQAARREFEEELGVEPPVADAVALAPFRAGTKTLHAFAVEGGFDPSAISPDDRHRSMVEIVWPPRSKQMATFPEVDRVAWTRLEEAAPKLHKGQAPLVAMLVALVADGVIRPG